MSSTVVKLSENRPDGYFNDSELSGWQIRIQATTGRTAITSSLVVDPN